MNDKIKFLREKFLRFERFSGNIGRLVKYLNRETSVDKLPDNIGNMRDAYNEIKIWNEDVRKAMKEQYGEIGYELFPFSRFLVKGLHNIDYIFEKK